MRRRQAREYSIQVLYMLETAGSLSQPRAQEIMEFFVKHFKITHEQGPDEDFWRKLLDGCFSRLGEIDALIEEQSEHWRLQRMSRVDRSILRMAVAELLLFTDIPASVTIDEALEISKRYGNEESASFINGILDTVWKKISPNMQKIQA